MLLQILSGVLSAPEGLVIFEKSCLLSLTPPPAVPNADDDAAAAENVDGDGVDVIPAPIPPPPPPAVTADCVFGNSLVEYCCCWCWVLVALLPVCWV